MVGVPRRNNNNNNNNMDIEPFDDEGLDDDVIGNAFNVGNNIHDDDYFSDEYSSTERRGRYDSETRSRTRSSVSSLTSLTTSRTPSTHHQLSQNLAQTEIGGGLNADDAMDIEKYHGDNDDTATSSSSRATPHGSEWSQVFDNADDVKWDRSKWEAAAAAATSGLGIMASSRDEEEEEQPGFQSQHVQYYQEQEDQISAGQAKSESKQYSEKSFKTDIIDNTRKGSSGKHHERGKTGNSIIVVEDLEIGSYIGRTRPRANGGHGNERISHASRHSRATNDVSHGTSQSDWSQFFENESISWDRTRWETLPTEQIEAIRQMQGSHTGIVDDMEEIFSIYFGDALSDRFDPYNPDRPTPPKRHFTYTISGTMAWTHRYIERKLCFSSIYMFIELCLRGIGQVYFQGNPISGFLILLGMFVQSMRVTFHGILALAAGNMMAAILRFDRGIMKSGLYGHNAFLVGLALSAIYSSEKHSDYYTPVAVASIIFGGLSALFFALLATMFVQTSPLTFPFNFAAIMFFLGSASMGHVDVDPAREPDLPEYEDGDDVSAVSISAKEFFAGVVRGVGQVYLADNVWSGVLVLLGITVCSRIGAATAVIGSAMGALTAIAFGVPKDDVENGMYGFNASLTVTAIFMFYVPGVGSCVMSTIAVIVVVAAQQALAPLLEPYGLPFLTLPFCVTALIFILLQGSTKIVVPVPLSSMSTPEDHLRKVRIRRDGANFFKDVMRSDLRAEKLRKKLESDAQGFGSTRIAKTSDGQQITIAKRKLKSPSSKKVNVGELRAVVELVSGKYDDDDDEEMKARPWVVSRSAEIFTILDSQATGRYDEYIVGRLTLDQFIIGLRSAELSDADGLHFASLVFNLFDVDQNGSITKESFVTMGLISYVVKTVRYKVAKFFKLVDIAGDGVLQLNEIDNALEYLGVEKMTRADRDRLLTITNTNAERAGISMTDLIDFVTVYTIKSMAAEYLHIPIY